MLLPRRTGPRVLSALCLIGILLNASCKTTQGSQSTAEPSASASVPTIHFLTFYIQKSASREISTVKLLNHQTATGTLNRQPVGIFPASLTCYLYQGKRLIDSVRIEHPLHKHLEYTTKDNTLASKDTVIEQAEFSIRYQTELQVNEVRMTETLPSYNTHKIATIKL